MSMPMPCRRVVPVVGQSLRRGAGGGAVLYERLDEELARSSRYGLPLCCVVFRVRGSRAFAEAPPERLTHAATVLARRIVRRSDVVGELGPGCFGVVANTSGEGARTLAESVAAALEALDFVHEGQPVAIDVSYGVSSLDEAKTAREMLEEARAALELRVPAHGIQGHC